MAKLTDSAEAVLKFVTSRFDVADDEDFVAELTDLLTEVETENYDYGHDDGESEGRDYGYDDGYSDGRSEGYDEGYDDGLAEGEGD